MKVTTIICILLFYYNVYSQKHQLDFSYRIGVPTKNFQIPIIDGSTRVDYLETKSVSDFGITLSYNYKIWKKYNVFLSLE